MAASGALLSASPAAADVVVVLGSERVGLLLREVRFDDACRWVWLEGTMAGWKPQKSLYASSEPAIVVDECGVCGSEIGSVVYLCCSMVVMGGLEDRGISVDLSCDLI